MKFALTRASDQHPLIIEKELPTVEVNSIEDLMKIDQDNGDNGLIIYFEHRICDFPVITIYDDYME